MHSQSRQTVVEIPLKMKQGINIIMGHLIDIHLTHQYLCNDPPLMEIWPVFSVHVCCSGTFTFRKLAVIFGARGALVSDETDRPVDGSGVESWSNAARRSGTKVL